MSVQLAVLLAIYIGGYFVGVVSIMRAFVEFEFIKDYVDGTLAGMFTLIGATLWPLLAAGFSVYLLAKKLEERKKSSL